MRVNVTNPTGNSAFLPRVFQAAYVTKELSKAQALLQARYGITNWHCLRDAEINPGTFVTIATAWVGDLMIEVIETRDGGGTVWHELPIAEGAVMVFHHFGHMLTNAEEWAQVNDQIERGKLKVAVRGSHGDALDYVYIDQRDLFGHFLEYVYCKESGLAFFKSIPQN